MVAKAFGSMTDSTLSVTQHGRRRLTRPWRQVLTGMSVLCIMALAPLSGYAGHPKVEPYSQASEAEKINLGLLQLEQEMRQQQLSFTKAATSRAYGTQGDGVKLDILMRYVDTNVEAQLVQAGAELRHVSMAHRRVSVVVHSPSMIYVLAQLPAVEMISPEYGAVVHTGSVDGRASEAMMADIVRLATSLDGSGQTVGILSDSFARSSSVRDSATTPVAGQPGTLTNSRPQRSGDLPPTMTLRHDGVFGRDEGAAMAELVHDIAPGAAIAFHTAFTGQAGFADGITDLCTTAGSTVVVDDVIYFAEPMYQDGIIAQAAAACVAEGVPYFSAAGNGANRGFRQLFNDITGADDTAATPSGNDLHDWGNGDGFLDVTLPPGASIRVVLQWNQPFASVSLGQGAEVDLDLYITPTPDAAGLANPLRSSRDVQGTTGFPSGDALEIAFYHNATPQPETVYLAIEHFDGKQDTIPQDDTTPLEFRLVFFESNAGTQIQGITNGSSAFGGPTMYGHAVAPGVVSVGAVPWFDTPVFNPGFEATGVTDPERFSSRGGDISILFDANGAFAPRTSFEPDIAAVDGNNTTFFGRTLSLSGAFGEPDSFPNFFGTSAAAPNAAAVAALMRQLNGLLTPAEITAAFVNTAVDITGFRAAPGRDDVTGAGLIDANAAIGSVLQGPNGVINTPAGHVTMDQGDAVTLTGTGISNDGHVPLSFFWDFDSGAPNSTLEDPGRVTFHTAGVFTVRFIVTDSQGTSDPTPAMVTITVIAPAQTRSGSGGGGGGCTLNLDAAGDFTLVTALGCILAYLGRKRMWSNRRTRRGFV